MEKQKLKTYKRNDGFVHYINYVLDGSLLQFSGLNVGFWFWYEIDKFIISIWNKVELPEEWKQSIIVPIYKMGDKTDCSNYRGISLSSTTYKISSNILFSKLTPHAEKMIGDRQCGFRRSR
jgi:hypothetical protein